MAELAFFCGTMDSGKSTLALQMDHNHAAAGRGGVLFTRNDRAGQSVLSSRLGLQHPAFEVTDATSTLPGRIATSSWIRPDAGALTFTISIRVLGLGALKPSLGGSAGITENVALAGDSKRACNSFPPCFNVA